MLDMLNGSGGISMTINKTNLEQSSDLTLNEIQKLVDRYESGELCRYVKGELSPVFTKEVLKVLSSRTVLPPERLKDLIYKIWFRKSYNSFTSDLMFTVSCIKIFL